MLHKLFMIFVVLPLGVLLVVFAVANRHPVTISFDPFGAAAPALSATAPLFLVILLMLGLGVVTGSFSTWLSQAKWRNRARQLEAELREVRGERSMLAARLHERDPQELPAPHSAF